MSDLVLPAKPLHYPSRLSRMLVVCALLVALGDWLFFQRDLGVSVPLFFAAVALGSSLTQRLARGRVWTLAVLTLCAALLPLVIDFNFLALGFGLLGLGAFVLMITRRWNGLRLMTLVQTIGLYLGAVWLTSRIARAIKMAWRRAERRPLTSFLIMWCVPLILGSIFVFLFASANPIIRDIFGTIDIMGWIRQLFSPRSVLWGLLTIFTLPLLRVTARIGRRRRGAGITSPFTQHQPGAIATSRFLSAATILRSLILFNLLFAMQSAMDVAYLWGGVRLPGHMTYAAYAHQGAYPLIATALLAAAFVLIALRPGSEAERLPSIRWLVTLWVGQNVLLVVSSILRLDLYVATYSLTTLRLFAAIWMGLVGFGLIFILARILYRRSNRWLIQVNLLTAIAVLYVGCFINFEAIVANYNVDHSPEFTGRTTPLDLSYFAQLGPQSLPALDRWLVKRAEEQRGVDSGLEKGRALRALLAQAAAQPTHSDWRIWTLQKAQLWHYLDTVQTQKTLKREATDAAADQGPVTPPAPASDPRSLPAVNDGN